MCWKDKDNFFYLTDAGRSIYRYSLVDRASFLVYGGLAEGKFVKNIRCNAGDLYFSFDHTSEIRRTADKYFGYHHYKLDGGDFTGIRIESLTPLFVVVGGRGGDIVEVNPGRNGLTVEFSLVGEENPQPSSSKQLVGEAVIQRFREEGVNTDGLILDFKF